MITVTTKKDSNGSGAGIIIARSGKTQKTTRYNHAKSSDWNHGEAAGALLLALDAKAGTSHAIEFVKGLHTGAVKHETSEGGGTHRFIL
jgi:hypothetical protein